MKVFGLLIAKNSTVIATAVATAEASFNHGYVKGQKAGFEDGRETGLRYNDKVMAQLLAENTQLRKKMSGGAYV